MEFITIIQNYLLPPTCVLCGQSGFKQYDLCYGCYSQLPQNTPCCYHCATPLTHASDMVTLFCTRCLRDPPAFDRVFAPFLYHDALSHLIVGLKFQAEYKNARLLGQLLAEQLARHTPLPDCILPIPLHKNRYRSRGFNQSIEIARTVARQLQRPVDISSCIRHRDTVQQVLLNAKQRYQSVHNAFSVLKTVQWQHIALLDDVMTTGATAHELALVLKNAGVRQVDVWVCARA